MQIDKVLELIKDDKRLCTSIQSIVDLPYQLPYIMSESIQLLDDDINSDLSDADKKSLCYMLDMYFGTCFYEYVEDLKLDSILKFGKIEIYKVQAHNGLRYATENEVLHGIKGLIPEYIYPAGEDTYKKLCLLQWTFSGISYFFRQAGYKLNYNSDGKVTTTLWEMLQMSAVQLKELMDWIKRNNLDKAIKIISKVKKAGGYKYAQYESDEIEESITVKQLIYNIVNTFPRNSDNIEYRRALAIAVARNKENRLLTPYEISQLRKTYDKFATDKDRNRLLKQSKSGEVNTLKQQCELIIESKKTGVLEPTEFVFKIINTLEKYGYTKCSPKQYRFIESALEKINSTTPQDAETEVIQEDDIDTSLMEMYDALGLGSFSS